jgi:bacillithiol biosynthesis cysteine-adding enzyme BshC
MKIIKVKPEETGTFSSLYLDYINDKENTRKYYGPKPSLDSFAELIAKRQFSANTRSLLQKVLKQQYSSIQISDSVAKNLEQIGQENTFTVTTGHQLNLATGPLYFVYKILSTIKLAEKLSSEHPNCNFIPVYWMASEDHDFEEINHFDLFGKTYTWQTNQSGPVGRFDTVDIANVLNSLPEKFNILDDAYTKFNNLADATRYLVNELFSQYGLLILDPDNRELKEVFSPILHKELFEGTIAKAAKENTQMLSEEGYKTQIHIRDLNVFLLKNGRTRLEVTENGFQDTEGNIYSKETIENLLKTNPEVFSPNVTLRPLYQEYILPNLAYFGGPAEIAYWLQLKSSFDVVEIPFPMLLPRNFFMLVNSNLANRIDQLNLTPQMIFKSEKDIKDKYLSEHITEEVTLEAEIENLQQVFASINDKAANIDKSLEGYVAAEKQKALKQLEHIERRIKKAEEQKHQIGLSQIENIKKKLFPNGSLQERVENIFGYYINQPDIIEQLKEQTDPLDFRFNWVELE